MRPKTNHRRILQSGDRLGGTARGGSSLLLGAKGILRRGVNAEGRGGNPQARVLLVEVGGAEHDAHGLGRHDGEVLGSGEVGEAELDVADNIGVFDRLVAGNPVEDGPVVRVVLLAGGLAHIVAGREQLVVLVGNDPETLAGKGGAGVDDAARLSQQTGAVVVEDLVGHGLLGRGVDAVGVGDGPRAAGLVAIVDSSLLGSSEGRVLAVEAVSVRVLGGSDGCLRRHGIVLDDRVVGAVNLGVDSEGEDVLVVVGVDGGSDLGAVGGGNLGGVHAVGVEHARQLDLELVGAVEGEGVVEAVLVVGGGDDLRDDELAVAGRDDGSVAVVGVLVQETVVFLVNADGILDDGGITLASSHDSVEIVDSTLAITSQLERVGHQTGTILTNVESVLLVVRRLGVTVGNHHLDDTDAVEQGALSLLVLILHADVGQNNTLAVVEANVHLVPGPRDLIAAHAEGHALGLGDVDGLEGAVNVVVTDKLGHVVVRGERHLGALSVDVADVDGKDLFLLGVDDDGEVEGVSVLVVVGRSSVVGETLLQTTLKSPSVVDANSPSIKEDLGHVVDANVLAGLDDTRVGTSDTLADVEILKSQGGTDL